MYELEDTARWKIHAASKKSQRERRAPRSSSEFVYFEDVMVKVQSRSGDASAHWVLIENERAWYDSDRGSPSGP